MQILKEKGQYNIVLFLLEFAIMFFHLCHSGGNYLAYSKALATMLKGNYFVYITSNPKKTVLYTGVTNDLPTRLQQHFENKGNSSTFAGKFYCYKLLYYERYSDVNIAIDREKEIKDISRDKKLELIKLINPYLDFLVVSGLE
ncbi:GIY-YIG nuclease family protein [Adhaeribacter rhizoryzae]|nr:GIY-YIG nuclease family protein [Adhaeribacter rhizoryzae]